MKRHRGLDLDYQHWFPQFDYAAPIPWRGHGQRLIDTEKDYERLIPMIYPVPSEEQRRMWARLARPHNSTGENGLRR